ncbi:hypothetical protein ATR1_407c0002, partial [Acetobacter tropicalis]
MTALPIQRSFNENGRGPSFELEKTHPFVTNEQKLLIGIISKATKQ